MTLLDIAEMLPARGGRRARSATMSSWRGCRPPIGTARRGPSDCVRSADDDALSAYLWLAFNCAYVAGARSRPSTNGSKHAADWRETPLIAFKAAMCRGMPSRSSVERLLEADPRFVEMQLLPRAERRVRGQDRRGDRSVAARLRLAAALAHRHPFARERLHGLEEFDRAVEFFDRTLAIVPHASRKRCSARRAR